MTEMFKINDYFAVGFGHPGQQDLEELARHGFRAVVNLRHQDEDNQPLQPDEEGEHVRSIGMKYVHIPVSGEALDESVVDRFRDSVSDLPAPIYVHCASGKRSGAFTMMHVASEENMSGDDAVQEAEAMGFECDSPGLEEFVRNYVDSHKS